MRNIKSYLKGEHMIRFISLIFFLFTVLFAKEYQIIEDRSDLKILNPLLSSRKTKKLILKNGLQLYLISDPNADQSAAALSVNAGSWNDPEKYPGTAHFLEHMLFKGTKAYPDEREFMRFIWERGGTPNAYTAPDRTVYMFSINHQSFEEALNRFSHFFIDPIFHPSGIERELFAVDQEFAKNIENDNWREYQISKEIGNPNHPNRKFSTGNSKTLSDIPRKELISFYKNNYSANLMRLVIYSSISLDDLTKMAIEKFQKVKDRLDEFSRAGIESPDIIRYARFWKKLRTYI